MSALTPDSTPAPPDPPVAPAAPASRRALTIGIVVALVALLLGVWLVVAKLPQLLTGSRNGAPEEPPPPATQADPRKIHVNLFYVSESGLELLPVGRDLPYGATLGEQARRVVEAQIAAPPEGQVSAIPAQTTVHAVYLAANGECYVDLGPEIVTHLTGGSLNEALAVYAIVNALTNLNGVTSVQILIDGKEVDTLAGHVDLRRPLTKTLDWIQKGK
jgi:hypothetical protein